MRLKEIEKSIFCRSSPHPYITALENRPDCWPALLLEIDDFIQRAVDRQGFLSPQAPDQRPSVANNIAIRTSDAQDESYRTLGAFRVTIEVGMGS